MTKLQHSPVLTIVHIVSEDVNVKQILDVSEQQADYSYPIV